MSMPQVLSQDEVDALLNAVGDDEDDGLGLDIGDDVDEVSDNIQPYDLTNQDRVIRGRMPILEIIYERFIRSVSCIFIEFTKKNFDNLYDFNRFIKVW
jgi:flagellar motor switch protein FliM